MGDVVTIPRKEPLLWVCACGCSTHRFYVTGAIECASCGNVASISGGEWVTELPAAPAMPKEIAAETKVISLSGSPQQAMREMLTRARSEDVMAFVSIATDGRVRTWGGISEKEQEDWLDVQLAAAKDLLMCCVPKSS